MSDTTQNEIDEELHTIIGQAMYRTNAYRRDDLRAMDLTPALADALWVIDPQEDPPTMKDISERLQCDPSSVTFLADRLLEKKIINRKADKHDHRARRITLTAKGKRLREKLIKATLAASVLSELSATDKKQLVRLLNKAVQRDDARRESE